MVERDQGYQQLRKKVGELSAQNTVLAESNETQKFVVQSLAAALAKAKKAAEEKEKIYSMQMRPSDLDGSGLPVFEFQETDEQALKQNEIAKQTLDHYHSRKGYDTFAGDMSSIWMNPDDLLENVASVRADDRAIYAESIVRQIEERPELDYSTKRAGASNAIFNFTRELERQEEEAR